MNRFIRNAVVIGVVCFGIVAAVELRPVAAADEKQAVLATDATFLQAIAKGNKAAVDKLLEPDFTWVDSNANKQTRAQVLQKLPSVANADVEPKVNIYGGVAVVKADGDKAKVMRIWVKHPAGWRALIYQEVALGSAPAAPPLPPGASTECDNPCKNFPYQPKNQTERDVLAALHGVIIGLAYYDADSYAANTADDFEMIVSTSPKVISKAERLTGFARQKQAAIAPSIPAPVTFARMFDFDGAVVLSTEWTTRNGLHDVNTRMFVPRNGRWVLLFGFETIG